MATDLENEQSETIAKLKKQIADYATKFEKRNEDLIRLGYYDNLTGLANRCIFYKNVEQKIYEAKRHNELIGMLYIDIDFFKKFNDSHGHHYGDSLLIEFTKRLKILLRESDLIAHMGGDEFAIMLERIKDVKDCAVVAQKIMGVMEQSFKLDDSISADITISIGISSYPESAFTVEDLIKSANTAMYKSKEMGRDNYNFYSEDIDLEARKIIEMEMNLRDAILAGNQFSLHYQPICDANTGEIVTCEALIRWNHPILGLIPPYKFIPIAEKFGLIATIGSWVIEEACNQCAKWQRNGINIPISVNISAKQFRMHDLPEVVQKCIFQSGIDPSNLILEVTEGILMDNVSHCKEALELMQAVGVQISIDDFGTGYSSLSYIKDFPFNKLKIDKSFIDDITSDKINQHIVRYTMDLAHNLAVEVIAEGVEEVEQLEILKSLGCDLIQGYYFSKPLPATEFKEYVLNNRKSA